MAFRKAHLNAALLRSLSVSAASAPKGNLRKPGGRDIVFIEGVRTPFLVSGTSYKTLMIHDLSRFALRGLIQRMNLDKSVVEYIALGAVVQVILEECDQNFFCLYRT